MKKSLICSFLIITNILFSLNVYSDTNTILPSICHITSDDTNVELQRNRMAEEFNEYYNLKKAGRFLKSMSSNTSTGFVLTSSSGISYIITSYDVLGYAKYAKVTFQNTGKSKSYRKCKVLFVSETENLALIEMPSKQASQGLSISNITSGELHNILNISLIKTSDKFEVVSSDVTLSGYKIQTKSMLSCSNPLIIQESGRYQIVGLTQSPMSKCDYNGEIISAQKIIDFVKKYEESTNNENKQTFENTINEFTRQTAESGAEAMEKYISDDMVMQLSKGELSIITSNLNENFADSANCLQFMSSIKILLAQEFCKDIKSNDDFHSPEIISFNETAGQSCATYMEGKVFFYWKYTYDGWKIYKSDSMASGNSNKSKTVDMNKSGLLYPKWRFMVSAKAIFPLDPLKNSTISYTDNISNITYYSKSSDITRNIGFGVEFSYVFKYFGLLNVGLDIQKSDIHTVTINIDKDIKALSTYTSEINFLPHICLGGQIPIHIKRFVLTPSLVGGLGLYVGTGEGISRNSVFEVILKPGLTFGYQFKNDQMIFIAVNPYLIYNFGSKFLCWNLNLNIGYAW